MLCLKVPTDSAWAETALRDVDAVLADHAHCELKAASSALALAARHAGHAAVARALTEVAREEIDHFQRVLDLLTARGIKLGPPPVDAYAASLRSAAASLPRQAGDVERGALVDRLLVAALIEARSCERFQLLAQATVSAGERAEEHALWTELLGCEARHYRTFLDLAVGAAGGDRAQMIARLDRLATLEGSIVAALPRSAAGGTRAAIHG